MAKAMKVETIDMIKSLSPPNSPKSSGSRSPSGSRFNFRKSLQKRTSKLMIFTKEKSTKDIRINAYTDEMIRLETVILSPKHRQLFVHDLLSLEGDHSVKVRFISAIDTFDSQTNKDERTRLGLKIVEMFVEKGGMFTIETLQPELSQALVEGNLEQLLQARKEVLEELSTHENVMGVVGVVEEMDCE